jgi:cystathionine beta-lyase/cystathionine gamma-synthase
MEVTYYDPLIGVGIQKLIKSNPRTVLTEAPGSQSFEMPDVPAIAAVAHAHGARVIDDNAWRPRSDRRHWRCICMAAPGTKRLIRRGLAVA